MQLVQLLESPGDFVSAGLDFDFARHGEGSEWVDQSQLVRLPFLCSLRFVAQLIANANGR